MVYSETGADQLPRSAAPGGKGVLLAQAVADVIDDQDNSTPRLAIGPQRVSALVAAPVILSCIGVGYGMSLMVPLHTLLGDQQTVAISEAQPEGARPTVVATPAPAALSESPGETPAKAAPAIPPTVLAARPIPVKATETPGPALAPTRSLETASVPQAAEPPRTADDPVASRAEPKAPKAQTKRATRAAAKRPKRLYRRPPPPQSAMGVPVVGTLLSLFE